MYTTNDLKEDDDSGVVMENIGTVPNASENDPSDSWMIPDNKNNIGQN